MQHLNKEEVARVNDTKHSIQAATAALAQVDARKIPNLQAIEDCLEDADKTLRGVLKTAKSSSGD